jgi:hypothetical protein
MGIIIKIVLLLHSMFLSGYINTNDFEVENNNNSNDKLGGITLDNIESKILEGQNITYYTNFTSFPYDYYFWFNNLIIKNIIDGISLSRLDDKSYSELKRVNYFGRSRSIMIRFRPLGNTPIWFKIYTEKYQDDPKFIEIGVHFYDGENIRVYNMMGEHYDTTWLPWEMNHYTNNCEYLILFHVDLKGTYSMEIFDSKGHENQFVNAESFPETPLRFSLTTGPGNIEMLRYIEFNNTNE